jgi:hypothetical protein
LIRHHISYNPPEVVVVCQKCHEKIHGNIPIVNDLNLKMRQYDMLVKLSVIIRRWRSTYKRTFGLNPIRLNSTQIEKKKQDIMGDVRNMLRNEVNEVSHIKGFHTRYLAGILAYAHPNRFPSLRKFLVYCGYKQSAKITGRYNRKVCSLVNQLARSVIIYKDEKYYPLYLKIKQDLAKRYPNYSKTKIDAMAKNRVGTFLLKEIYSLFHQQPTVQVQEVE